MSRNDLVKGYEVSRCQYAEVAEEELDALEAEVNRNVDIQEFVPVAAVDPVYFKKTYHFIPNTGSERPDRLLAHAMRQEERGAIEQLVQRGKEEFVMIRAVNETQLMLHVLYYGVEVRAFERPSSGIAAPPKELELATELIHHLASNRREIS